MLKAVLIKPIMTVKAALSPRTLSRWLSDEGLTKKAYLNALAVTLDYGARMAAGFIINPLLVAGLGNYAYGLWQILGRLIGYISAASGRPTQALKWTIAYRQASNNYDEKRRNVGSAVVVWLLFLPLLSVLGGILAWFAPVWLKTPMDISGRVRLTTALLVADLILTTVADIPHSVLQGENLGYKRMGISTALVFVPAGCTALAVRLNTGLVGVAVANLVDPILTGVFFLLIVRTYAPWFGIAIPSIAEVKKFFRLSWWFLVWSVVNQLMMASDVVVLGILGSVESVTIYTLTKYVPETLIGFVANVVFGITPGLGGIIGSGDLRKAVRVRSEIIAATWFIATATGATTILWDRSFVRLWVGKGHYAGSIPTLLIMFMVTQLVLIRNDANIIDLTLKLSRKVLIGMLSAGLSLVLAGILVGPLKLGVIGLCVGFIAGRSILSIGYPWIVGRAIGIPLSSQLKSALRPALTTFLLFTLALGLGEFYTASTWIGLVLAVGVTVVPVSLLAFYAGVPAEQRKHLLDRAWRAIRV